MEIGMAQKLVLRELAGFAVFLTGRFLSGVLMSGTSMVRPLNLSFSHFFKSGPRGSTVGVLHVGIYSEIEIEEFSVRETPEREHAQEPTK